MLSESCELSWSRSDSKEIDSIRVCCFVAKYPFNRVISSQLDLCNFESLELS